ncbi:hypothetical protein BH11BAC2_BH11BAC2_26320 [soil metagenome]
MKAIAIIALMLLISSGIFAQKFRAEIQAGVAGSQVSGDELSGFNKGGLLVGGGVRLKMDEKWSFGLRMLYLQKGSRKLSKLDKGDPTTYLLRLNYLEFPLLFRYQLISKLYVEIGPSLGYLVKSSEENEDGEIESRNPFKKVDLSIAGGIGYPLGKNWDIQMSFWQSMLAVREHTGGATYRLNRGQYNSVIAVTLMHTFMPSAEK